jgi:hypothetical protein
MLTRPYLLLSWRYTRSHFTTSRQLLVLLVCTCVGYVKNLWISPTAWRPKWSSNNPSRNAIEMTCLPNLACYFRCVLQGNRLTTSWQRNCLSYPDWLNILSCVPCTRYLCSLILTLGLINIFMLYYVTAIYLNCCYRNDTTLRYDSCNCQLLRLK